MDKQQPVQNDVVTNSGSNLRLIADEHGEPDLFGRFDTLKEGIRSSIVQPRLSVSATNDLALFVDAGGTKTDLPCTGGER